MNEPALQLVPLFAAYLRKVQCNYCRTEIFWHESDAVNEAEHQILCCGARDIDDLKQSIKRICCACDYQRTRMNRNSRAIG